MCLCSGLFDVLESALFGFRPYLRDVSSCVDHPHTHKHTHTQRQQTDNMTINGVELAGEKKQSFCDTSINFVHTFNMWIRDINRLAYLQHLPAHSIRLAD